MQNKKTIMAFSTLFIVIFHLWIYVTSLQIEAYVRQLGVIGVDLFFFVSAYSIAKRENINYKHFIIDRFCKIYLKFLIFSIIAMFYFNWSETKFIKVILGIELFERGGGSFLWFLPSIMIVYFLLPIYKIMDTKYPKIVPFVTVLLYLFISIIISKFTSYNALFILTNRIPIILLGYYFEKYNVFKYLRNYKIRYWLVTITTLVLGILGSYFVYKTHFKVTWFYDLFYILYIPLNIGIILLLDNIKVGKIGVLIGSITLELYGIQMIFGFPLATLIFQYIRIPLLSNIIIIIILIIISLSIKYIFDLKDKIKLKKLY